MDSCAETAVGLFLSAVERDGELWPSRFKVDYGVENVLVCDKMLQVKCEGKGGGRGGGLYCRVINTQPTD